MVSMYASFLAMVPHLNQTLTLLCAFGLCVTKLCSFTVEHSSDSSFFSMRGQVSDKL